MNDSVEEPNKLKSCDKVCRHLGSISSTFYEKLLGGKCKNIQLSGQYLITLSGSAHAKAVGRTFDEVEPRGAILSHVTKCDVICIYFCYNLLAVIRS